MDRHDRPLRSHHRRSSGDHDQRHRSHTSRSSRPAARRPDESARSHRTHSHVSTASSSLSVPHRSHRRHTSRCAREEDETRRRDVQSARDDYPRGGILPRRSYRFEAHNMSHRRRARHRRDSSCDSNSSASHSSSHGRGSDRVHDKHRYSEQNRTMSASRATEGRKVSREDGVRAARNERGRACVDTDCSHTYKRARHDNSSTSHGLSATPIIDNTTITAVQPSSGVCATYAKSVLPSTTTTSLHGLRPPPYGSAHEQSGDGAICATGTRKSTNHAASLLWQDANALLTHRTEGEKTKRTSDTSTLLDNRRRSSTQNNNSSTAAICIPDDGVKSNGEDAANTLATHRVVLYGVDMSVTSAHARSIVKQLLGVTPVRVYRPALDMLHAHLPQTVHSQATTAQQSSSVTVHGGGRGVDGNDVTHSHVHHAAPHEHVIKRHSADDEAFIFSESVGQGAGKVVEIDSMSSNVSRTSSVCGASDRIPNDNDSTGLGMGVPHDATSSPPSIPSYLFDVDGIGGVVMIEVENESTAQALVRQLHDCVINARRIKASL